MSAEPDNAADLLQRIAETDAIIAAAETKAVDPEGRRLLADAYRQRALALTHLDRHAESAADWDHFLRIWTEVEPRAVEDYARLRAEALDFRGYSLRSLDRRDEAQQLDAELIERFSHESDPVIEKRVDRAITRRAYALLNRPGRVSEALALSDRLLARFNDTALDDLADRADLLLIHARTLVAIYPIGLVSLARVSTEMAMNTGAETVTWLSGAVDARLPVAACGAVTAVLGRYTPRMLIRHRRRMAQAREVTDTVRARLARSEDPDLLVIDRRARLIGAYTRMFLGHPQDGYGEFWDFEPGNDPVAVRAFAEMAAEQAQRTGWLNQLGTAGLLGMRAHALVGDDPKLQRIAYDDSIERHLPERPALPVRVVVHLARPGVDASDESQQG